MSRRNSSTPSQPNNQRNIPPSSTTRSNRPQRFNLIVPADITASIGQTSTTPQPQANAARTSSTPSTPTTPRHPSTPRPQVNTARTSRTPSTPSTPTTPKPRHPARRTSRTPSTPSTPLPRPQPTAPRSTPPRLQIRNNTTSASSSQLSVSSQLSQLSTSSSQPSASSQLSTSSSQPSIIVPPSARRTAIVQKYPNIHVPRGYHTSSQGEAVAGK